MDFAVLADHRMKIKGNSKMDQYLELAREQKKTTTVEYESDSVTDCSRCTWNDLQKLGWKDWRIWKSEEESKSNRQ